MSIHIGEVMKPLDWMLAFTLQFSLSLSHTQTHTHTHTRERKNGKISINWFFVEKTALAGRALSVTVFIKKPANQKNEEKLFFHQKKSQTQNQAKPVILKFRQIDFDFCVMPLLKNMKLDLAIFAHWNA